MFRFLPNKKSVQILDFGCGKDFPITKKLRALGYGNTLKYDPEISLVNPVEYLSAWGPEFDVIICRHVAYYFERKDLNHYFSEFKRILKPGGILLIEVINGASFTAQWPYRNDLNTKIIFTEISLREELVKAGFTDTVIVGESVTGTNILWRIARFFWWKIMATIYILERGRCSRNPSVFSKNLIARAQ